MKMTDMISLIMYHYTPTKGQGDILVSVRISLALATQILVPTISLESVNGILPNLHGYCVGANVRADHILVTLTDFKVTGLRIRF